MGSHYEQGRIIRPGRDRGESGRPGPCPNGAQIQQCKEKLYLLKCEADLAGPDACSAVCRPEKRK